MGLVKKTDNGTIAAYTYHLEESGENSDGIAIGQYAPETVVVKNGLHGILSRTYGLVSVENDPDNDNLRVIVLDDNCRKFGVPMYVYSELEDGTGAYVPVNTDDLKAVVMVENVENQMVANRHPSLLAAQKAMFKRYVEVITGRQFRATKYAKMDFPACLPELKNDPDMDDGDTRGIKEEEARIWDGPNHDNYSWKIFEL